MSRKIPLAVIAAAMASLSSSAQAQADYAAPEDWQFSARVYLYLADLRLDPSFPTPSGSAITVDASQLLDNLNFAAMGSFEASNGRFGAFTDLIYMNVGKDVTGSRDVTLGNVPLPAGVAADLSYNNKTLIWTMAAEARLATQPSYTFDGFLGARMLNADQDLDWTFTGSVGPIPVADRMGSGNSDKTVWDAIAGVKAQVFLDADRRWSLPFYADIGTGGSDLTFQLSAGVNYRFGTVEVGAMWRYIDYDLKASSPYRNVSFNGPLFAVGFHF